MYCDLVVLRFSFSFTMHQFELTVDLVLMMLLLTGIGIGLTLAYFGLTVPVLIDIAIKALRNSPRDIRAAINMIKLQLFVAKCKYYNYSVYDVFKKTVDQHPNKVAYYFKEETWTFARLYQYSAKVRNYFHDEGLRSGEEVCLLMSNRPEYVGLWLGLSSIGVASALINTNTKKDFLLNAITAVNAKHIIFESQYYHAIFDILEELRQLRPAIQLYQFGPLSTEQSQLPEFDPNNNSEFASKRIDDTIESYDSAEDHIFGEEKPNFRSNLFYIYTSGTTGYSKAAIFRNYRLLFMTTGTTNYIGLSPSDTIYVSLPLYHANSMVITAAALTRGITCVIKDKFSASEFWPDCCKYKCTAANYIGEVCRYLLAQPVRDCDRKHQIRLMFGNGLRPQIWRDFQTRFAIKKICEFYASTEGNVSTINITGKEGACGFYPYYYGIIVRLIYPLIVLKVDESSGELVRDRKGLCVSAGQGEVGQICGRITSKNVMTYFDGYTNSGETCKKIVSNVFSKGDQAFLSGDLVRLDGDGYLTFVDRTGDTFRWKGENVSTAEVESVIQRVTKLSDCVVFGVQVFGCEGKAGMAVIADKSSLIDTKKLAEDLTTQLPSYAVPLFLRLTTAIEMTGTYKLLKNKFVDDQYSPELTSDPLFYLDIKQNTYLPIDKKVYDDLTSGVIRF